MWKRVLLLGLTALMVACGGTQAKTPQEVAHSDLNEARHRWALTDQKADEGVLPRSEEEAARVTLSDELRNAESVAVLLAGEMMEEAKFAREERCRLTHDPVDCQLFVFPATPSGHIGLKIEGWALKSVHRLVGNWPVWVDSNRVVIFDPADPSLSRYTTIKPKDIVLPACIVVYGAEGEWSVQRCPDQRPTGDPHPKSE